MYHELRKRGTSRDLAQIATFRKPSDLLLKLADAVEAGDPVSRRAPPDLPLRHQLIALFQHSDTHDVHRLLSLAGRGRIKRCAAGRAERLRARISALGRGLDVDRRLAADLECGAGN